MANPAEKRSLINTLYQAGFRDNALRTAYAIAMRESGGRASAFNPDVSTGDQSYGLFQINMLGDMGPARRRQFGIQSNQQLLDPAINAKAAFKLSGGGKDFGAWGIGPNAYRQGAGMDTIRQYYDEYPKLAPQAYKNPETQILASQTARNLQINATPTGKDPETVGSYAANTAILNANQDQISDEVRQYMAGQARRNQLIRESAPSETTRSLLRNLGSPLADRKSPELSLPEFPSVIYQPKQVNPLVEAHVNTQYGGTTSPPLSSKTGNVPGVADPHTPKVIQNVLKIAHDQIGKPYVWGADTPEKGFDCSGLIEYAYEKAGIPTPGRLTTYTMAKLGKSVKGEKYLPGDWVITNGGKHVVMYVGKGKVIAAPHTGEVVQYQDLSRFKGDIVDVRRFR